VLVGEKLGVVRRTGITAGTHLYFGMISAGKPVDPAPYLGAPPCGGAIRRTETAQPDVGEISVNGRKYYQIFFPAVLPAARQLP
jgi:hypothetical protein